MIERRFGPDIGSPGRAWMEVDPGIDTSGLQGPFFIDDLGRGELAAIDIRLLAKAESSVESGVESLMSELGMIDKPEDLPDFSDPSTAGMLGADEANRIRRYEYIRGKIAGMTADYEESKWVDDQGRSVLGRDRLQFFRKSTQDVDNQSLVRIAKQVVEAYHGTRNEEVEIICRLLAQNEIAENA